ncbi:hypothetical protein ACEQPO_16995 [Bacillus sp. SL00103]
MVMHILDHTGSPMRLVLLAEIVFGSKGQGAITKTGTTTAKTTVKKGLEQGARSLDKSLFRIYCHTHRSFKWLATQAAV